MNKLVQETCQEVKEMCQEIKKMCQGVKDICLEVRECGTSYRKWLQCYGNVPVVGAKLSIFPDNKGNFNPFLHTFPGGIFWLGRHFLAPFLSRIQELLTFCHLHKHAKS